MLGSEGNGMTQPSPAHDARRDATRDVRAAVARAFWPYAPDTADGAPHRAAISRGRVLLAVSGGRDSMVLLHAAAIVARNAACAVATFDHATGPHASQAVARVQAAASAFDLPVVTATAPRAGRNESEWRSARWAFLRSVAAEFGAAAIATAHTRDDAIETVVIRALRGAGARGLAALAAPISGDPVAIVRPLLGVSRRVVAAYAFAHAVDWSDDPSNLDRRHVRVRVRRDLLGAMTRMRPGATHALLRGSAAAARWRVVADAWSGSAAAAGSDDGVAVPVRALGDCGPEALAVFWPAFAARAGVRLDRRAIERLVAYTPSVVARVRAGTVQPARVPVAGGVVELACGRTSATGSRAWQFRILRVGAAHDPLGMAASLAPDYA